jgi:hypothetical protein
VARLEDLSSAILLFPKFLTFDLQLPPVNPHLQQMNDAKEDPMIGHRRTIPLWRQRRTSPLAVERALGQRRPTETSANAAEQRLLGQKAARRMVMTAKHRARLSDG